MVVFGAGTAYRSSQNGSKYPCVPVVRPAGTPVVAMSWLVNGAAVAVPAHTKPLLHTVTNPAGNNTLPTLVSNVWTVSSPAPWIAVPVEEISRNVPGTELVITY